MRFFVSDESGKPKYEQLKTQIRSAVYSGELADEGIVHNEQGRGTFIAQSSAEVLRRRLMTKTRESLEEACAAAQRAGMSMSELEQMLADIYTDIEQQRLG
ncbi:GntR family transcriptional regulator [uncultured Bifidobacterium sp.]|uniref:GntR family transcriptional regulator n=1 Tax=uncultured Bifidobacterium sp. TaxID=165187 RepID=UPI002589F013|nr:GntR family transcriptional regulator [uncultured Bifidobacterium sp.]